MATETTTQFVCDPERVTRCPCADADGDLGEFTCACSEPNIASNCETCGSPMVLVRWDTGEPIEAVAS